jgi:methylthioribose-1-phosphate isomerase
MKTIEWLKDRVKILDQTRLPDEEIFLELSDYREVVEAIKELRVRGAPAIGIAAAYGIALGAQGLKATSPKEFLEELYPILEAFSSSRPTAVHLFRVVERMEQIAQEQESVTDIKVSLVEEAHHIYTQQEEADRLISQFGTQLIQDGFTILTHCNAGALATGSCGGALGAIKVAKEQGKKVKVFATETRPLFQGARLTTWELMRWGIPVTLITDSMAGYILSKGKIDCVIVGADRIASNGDVANKIGTYTLAVLAMENGVPFYVSASLDTIDFSLPSGDKIPIEERSPEEITHIRGVPITPRGVRVFNPAFDVTPHHYITAIITEKGLVREPYELRLRKLVA